MLGIFKIVLLLRNQHFSRWHSLGILKVFNTTTLKQFLLKTKTFFKKLKYRFLVESTKIENATFPNKIVLSETNVRQIEWRVQNGPAAKDGVSPVTTSFFWNFCFSLRTSYKELTWCIRNQMSIFILFVNGPAAKDGVSPVTTSFFWNFCFSLRTSYKELTWCMPNQMSIFILFVSAGVLFEGAFSLWVSLRFKYYHKYWKQPKTSINFWKSLLNFIVPQRRSYQKLAKYLKYLL